MDENKLKKIASSPLPPGIPMGDMPGDRIDISDGVIKKTGKMFPELYTHLEDLLKKRANHRATVSIYGPSGSGKSCTASVLAYMLSQAGMGCLIISGDNYPRRIPCANDNERLHIFRTGGVRHLAAKGILDPNIVKVLRELQSENRDSDPEACREYPWLSQYISGGTGALASYIGSPHEIDFDEVNGILRDFLKGGQSIWLKRMGRDEASLWYDKVDMTDKDILILEWTHGNSRYLDHIDLPVFLNTTPEETLVYRKKRARDTRTDSSFTSIVLTLEQKLLMSQIKDASLIVSDNGTVTGP